MYRIVFTSIALAFTAISFGQNTQKMDSLMSIHEAKGFSGNVLYSKNDSTVFKGSYGFANFKTRTALTDETIFDLASLSKQFTAVCIIQLVEKGIISYDTKLEELWEDFPYQGIAIEHLLRHQSGLPDYFDLLSNEKYWNARQIATNDDLFSIMSQHDLPLHFTPGTSHEYSNTGYAVLASVVEEVSGLTFEEYLQKNIFKPLQMNSSRVVRRVYKPDPDPAIATGYYRSGDKNKANYLFDKQMKIYDGIVGDGTIHSTTLDMLKWKVALKNNSLITAASKELMFSGDEIDSSYGYGLVVKTSDQLGKYVLHSGAWQGFETFFLYIPLTDECVVVLSNNSYEAHEGISNDLLKYARE